MKTIAHALTPNPKGIRFVLLLSLAGALLAAPAPKAPLFVRLDISGLDQKLELADAAVLGPGKFTYGTYLKEKARQLVYSDQPVPANTWTEVGLSFTPEADGEVVLALTGKYWAVDGKTMPVLTFWDDLTAKGCALVNGGFEERGSEGPKGWTLSGAAEPVAKLVEAPDPVRSGAFAARGWHDSKWIQRLTVKKGMPVEVRAWAFLRDASATVPLDLSKAGNMALADEIDGDQKGGWTDQGRLNDLSALKPGLKNFAGIQFRIAEGPRAAIVLKGPQREYFPEKATLVFPAGAPARHLYLLHGVAWAPKAGQLVGRIVPILAGGAEGEPIPVLCGRDAGGWWSPSHLSNAYVAFTAENKSAFVGLYASRFPLPAGALAARLESAGTGVWGIVGAALSESSVAFPEIARTVIAPGAAWIPYVWEKEIVPGSAMDLSGLLEAPAGKAGFVGIGPGAGLVFEKTGKPFRFSGNNFSAINASVLAALRPEERTLLAVRLAHLGYNLLRIAYLDNAHLKQTETGSEIDPAGLDALDHFTAELKKRGVYLVADFLMGSRHRAALMRAFPGEKLGDGDLRPLYEAAYFVEPAIRDDHLRTAKRFLEHVNPYTRLAPKDEPQWVFFNILNEDPLSAWALRGEQAPRLMGKYWNAHLKKKYGESEALRRAWGRLDSGDNLERGTVALPKSLEEGPRGEDLTIWFAALHREGWTAMKNLMRSVGSRALLTDINMAHDRSILLARDGFDLVDQHAYHDHPQFPQNEWGLPYGFHQKTSLRRSGWTGTHIPSYLALSRHVGKPYAITEYDHCFPNGSRMEAGLVYGAQAALQGWDGMLNFNYSYHTEDLFPEYPAKFFDKVNEPIGAAAERQVKFLYLRGDVKTAATGVALRLERELVAASNYGMNGAVQALAMVTAVGLAFDEPRDGKRWTAQYPMAVRRAAPGWLPATAATDGEGLAAWLSGLKGGLLPKGNRSDLGAGILETATGEVVYRFNEGALSVDTPRSKGFVAHTNGAMAVGGLRASFEAAPCSLSFHSLDGRPLESSRRILVFLLTDVLNKGMTFDDEGKKMLNWGELPHLLRAGRARVSLRNGQPLKAWAISASGRRMESVPLEAAGGEQNAVLDQRLAKGSTLFWEWAVE
ncbi:MAG: hypothetical protein J0L75_13575 [Spirochaetes bacterium]|nr:hypothetical protein [Spirochaetota bacterium]